MKEATRIMLVTGTLVLMLIITLSAQVPPAQIDRGQEWLSWSPAEKAIYVNGFLTGYSNGSHAACLLTEELFEVGKRHQLEDQPSARCYARLETYTKFTRSNSGSDFSNYTNVITDFYTQHPEYQNIPFFYLMRYLSDRQYKTSDELYRMALKGELRTNF